MESHGDHFLSYYLTKDDAAAEEYHARRLREGDADETEEVCALSPATTPGPPLTVIPQPVAFHFVRDYEVTKVEQEVPDEFLLVIDDGPDGDLYGAPGARPKGAYYKNIERKMQLKKKRAVVRVLPSCSTFADGGAARRELRGQVGRCAAIAHGDGAGGGRGARRVDG
jgi:RNA polymerase II-associated factor 1